MKTVSKSFTIAVFPESVKRQIFNILGKHNAKKIFGSQRGTFRAVDVSVTRIGEKFEVKISFASLRKNIKIGKQTRIQSMFDSCDFSKLLKKLSVLEKCGSRV